MAKSDFYKKVLLGPGTAVFGSTTIPYDKAVVFGVANKTGDIPAPSSEYAISGSVLTGREITVKLTTRDHSAEVVSIFLNSENGVENLPNPADGKMVRIMANSNACQSGMFTLSGMVRGDATLCNYICQQVENVSAGDTNIGDRENAEGVAMTLTFKASLGDTGELFRVEFKGIPT